MSTHDSSTLSRRRFIEITAGGVVVAAAALSRPARAAELPPLNPQDPVAQALGYSPDTTEVLAAKYPNHKPSQACGTCTFFKGEAGAQWGPCPLFPGKEVHVTGWCSAYTAKQ